MPTSRIERPRILVVTTGGTIASRRDPVTGAVSTAVNGEELLEIVPQASEIADVELRNFAAVNGWNMTPPMMFDLAQLLNAELKRPDLAGAVVTHGTDTVEETAYLVDLMLQSEKPVMFAVALRNISELGADGPRNLTDAIFVAASPAAGGYGCLLVANQTVHAARFVTKTHTTHLDAFESLDFGPVGMMTHDGVRFLRPAFESKPLIADRIESEVFLFKAAAGADSRPLVWAISAGYKGIVVEGSGAGNVPAAVIPGITAAIEAGLPVVLATRCIRGFLSLTYGSGGAAGGGWDLAQLGAIPASHLPAQKARIKLMLALGSTSTLDEIRVIFERDNLAIA
jgi:L-asparaginase